jgi:catechol 2,3-dioxygenase-like lactoylglutathione lyase family enzyme
VTDPVVEFVVVITTAAFDASLGFYRDVIGLQVVEEWTDAGTAPSSRPVVRPASS